jgi:hypothetical protein
MGPSVTRDSVLTIPSMLASSPHESTRSRSATVPCGRRPAPAALRSGDLTLLGEYADAVDTIRALLARPGLNEAALRSGIRQVIAERLPVPDDGWIRPGSTWGEIAVMIAGRLRSRPGPATTLFAQLAGEPVRVQAGEPGDTTLDEGLAAGLDAAPGTPCWHRDGRLTAPLAGVTVAVTQLDLIPARIPPAAMARIRGGEPCGPVLAGFGMRREAREADPTGGDPAVEAMAKLRIGEITVGRAAEKVPLAFCQMVAAASGRVIP